MSTLANRVPKSRSGMGRSNRKPCCIVQPNALRQSAWARVSTPSATTRNPNARPSAMIEAAIAPSRSPRQASVTNARSILSSSIGNRLR